MLAFPSYLSYSPCLPALFLPRPMHLGSLWRGHLSCSSLLFGKCCLPIPAPGCVYIFLHVPEAFKAEAVASKVAEALLKSHKELVAVPELACGL